MGAFLQDLVADNGAGLAVVGGMLAVMLGGWGSARGLRISGAQSAGVLTEKPELYGKCLVLTVLPATQGLYGLVGMIMIAVQTGLMAGEPFVTPGQGMAVLLVGAALGVVLYFSAVFQGETCAACINLTSKRPDEMGRSLVFPILVEFYALLALLAEIILIIFYIKPPVAAG